ncbi:hypothetical protein AVEN_253964-1 [Araneus ventricosus]|uniref:Uncharacterized protein n=1 Tax=Araneus ventricosus TaxID=182803 RepID=A0A4Y2U4D6_ARAVE|nr:hypothetical protein AVEN_3424-1 [Araneus ventricosus]GBO06465.1 hypothetical protein AVEN_253964-1 [Araneus ventricosus]
MHVTEHKMKGYTFERPDEKVVKIVLRRPPPDFPLEIIQKELVSDVFDPLRFALRKSRNISSNMPLFLVNQPKINISKDNYEVESIEYVPLKIEPLRSRNFPGQSFNCQQIFHDSRMCSRVSVCLK